MAIYKPYPKYKNSNIPWLGEIPEHWEVKRAKWIFSELSIKGFPNEQLLAATQTKGVVHKSKYENRTVIAQNNLETLKLVEPGNFVISLRSFQGGIELAHDRGIISPAYTVLSLKELNETGYFRYLLKSKRYISSLTLLVTGIREGQNIDTSKFKDSFLPLPSIQEQTAIARFLDYKLAKINRFIQKKKQLIKLLNEQKAAIINQVVTKGLDPNVKMKDSGIEWLGEIPQHWEKYKLKYLISKPIAGAWGTEPQNDDNDITCVRVADFSEYEIKTDNLTIRNIEAKTEQILKPGDLLLEKSGGGEKTPVGRVVLFNQSFKAVTSNFVSKFSPKIDLVSSEYLLYIFKLINSVRWNFRSLKQTTGIQNIDTYQYMDNWVFIPKIEEQKIIVNHIKSEFKILDETISKIEKEIALVEEYKTALIAEAVTGKIDVRGYEVPEVTEEETYEEIEEEISITSEDAEAYQTVEE